MRGERHRFVCACVSSPYIANQSGSESEEMASKFMAGQVSNLIRKLSKLECVAFEAPPTKEY